jgi:microcystin-dependent protein
MPYVSEIRMFGSNFAPAAWAFCDGQVLPISQYVNRVPFKIRGRVG